MSDLTAYETNQILLIIAAVPLVCVVICRFCTCNMFSATNLGVPPSLARLAILKAFIFLDDTGNLQAVEISPKSLSQQVDTLLKLPPAICNETLFIAKPRDLVAG